MSRVSPRHSVSVAGIVIEDGRALAIQRADNGHWEPPGGVLELDEAPEDGVVREVLEETGVAVEVHELAGVYKNLNRGIVALVFRCSVAGGTPTPTTEAVAVEWLDRAALTERVAPAYLCRFLDAMDEERTTTAIRSHDGTTVLGTP